MSSAHYSTLIAFDFGMRKIGIAVGQCITKTARPLETIRVTDGIPNWDDIAKIIDSWQPDALVVGLPINLDGSDQPITLAARKFSRRLHARYKLPVFLQDERLTSKAASTELRQREDKKTSIDSVAASLILETWMRENIHDKT